MTEREPREELRDIAGSLQRWLRRESAAGNAELIAHSVGEARARLGMPTPAAPVAPAIAEAPGAGDAPASHAAPPRAAAPPPIAALPSSWESVTPSAPPRASAPMARAAMTAEPAAEVADVDLFGESAPKKTWTPRGGDDPVMPLPPIHPPLHSIETSVRREIQSASLAVLEEVAREARACRKCGLCETRTQAVPGVGSAFSGIVFVGEAPGADEDAQGEPFVGRAGQLLTQMIRAMDEKQLIPGVTLSRETVYICNVLKCRPPENRNPLPHEIEQCSPYLKRQLEALKPRVICCLGKFSAELLVGVKSPSLGAMRGKTYRYQGAKLIVTYHPAALLRNPGWKRPAWEDLQRLATEYLTDSPGA
jgi:DNA polymerase